MKWIFLTVSLFLLGGCVSVPPPGHGGIIRIRQGQKAPCDGIFMDNKTFDELVDMLIGKPEEPDPRRGRLVKGE